MANWEFVNYEGKLAITMGWDADSEKPIQVRSLWVHPSEPYSAHYEQYSQIRLVQNNYFSCYNSNSGGYVPLSTDGWEQKVEQRDIPKPGRGGKNWKWVWNYGRWVKGY